jgi:polyisoprenoid-binding protein YceI
MIETGTGSLPGEEPGTYRRPISLMITRFPKARFVSTKIEKVTTGDATYNVTGNFELHGVKKSISFPATIQIAPDSVSVNSEFAVNRKDFGLVYPGKADDLIRDGVVIKLSDLHQSTHD